MLDINLLPEHADATKVHMIVKSLKYIPFPIAYSPNVFLPPRIRIATYIFKKTKIPMSNISNPLTMFLRCQNSVSEMFFCVLANILQIKTIEIFLFFLFYIKYCRG